MRLFVSLSKAEFDALRELAQNERRRPQDQAAVILAHSLRTPPRQAASNPGNPTEPVAPREYEEAERAAV